MRVDVKVTHNLEVVNIVEKGEHQLTSEGRAFRACRPYECSDLVLSASRSVLGPLYERLNVALGEEALEDPEDLLHRLRLTLQQPV